jgi:hypothetical protein
MSFGNTLGGALIRVFGSTEYLTKEFSNNKRTFSFMLTNKGGIGPPD